MLLRTIIYDHSMDEFMEEILEIKKLFSIKGIEIAIEEMFFNNQHIVKLISCNESEEDNRTINNTLNLYLSMMLYKVLSAQYINNKLKNIIRDQYFFLKNNEVSYIIKKVDEALNSDKVIIEKKGIHFINKKNDMLSQIIDSIKEIDEVNLNGVLTFKKSIVEESFVEITKDVIENYMAEKEYKEFIKLLKYFVNLQESVMEEVNIIIKENREYNIVDKKGEDIFNKLIGDLKVGDLQSDGINKSINTEDLIISGLITNVPKRIIIHGYNERTNNEFINTIKDVFLERVGFCSGCEFCISTKLSRREQGNN